jgi:hypothetical protein
MEVESMKDSTLVPNEFRDLIIALVALLITLLLWSVFMVPAAV